MSELRESQLTDTQLWWDTSTRSLEEKIEQAAVHYQKRFGKSPDVCLVDVNTALTAPADVNGIAVLGNAVISPNRFFLACIKTRKEA